MFLNLNFIKLCFLNCFGIHSFCLCEKEFSILHILPERKTTVVYNLGFMFIVPDIGSFTSKVSVSSWNAATLPSSLMIRTNTINVYYKHPSQFTDPISASALTNHTQFTKSAWDLGVMIDYQPLRLTWPWFRSCVDLLRTTSGRLDPTCLHMVQGLVRSCIDYYEDFFRRYCCGCCYH